MAIDFPNSPATGQLYQSGDKTWRYDGEKWTIYATIVVVDSTPIGSIQAFAGSTAPTGWMLAYGQAISRVTFSDLFTVIGTTYGVGDGSTTFNLPDLRGRTIAGVDNMGGSAASRLTSTTITGGADALGEVGGTQTHTLTTAEMPSHTHTQNSHNHAYYININHPDGTPMYGEYLNVGIAFGNGRRRYIDATELATATNQNTGGGAAHNNVQPTMVLNYLIKYGPSSTVNVVDDQFMLPAQIFS